MRELEEVLFPALVAVAMLVGCAVVARGTWWALSPPNTDETCGKCVASCAPFPVASCFPQRRPYLDSPVRVECACAVDGGTP